MNRRNQILAIVLVVQLALAAVVLWPRGSVSGGEVKSLFPDVTADQIVAMTISDASGQTVDLAKQGSDWVLPNVDNYPILPDKAPALTAKIVALKTDRLVAQNSTSYKRLKVASDDFQRLIEFRLTDGSSHKLYLGTSPSYGAIHVRADDQNGVYLASDLSTTDAGVTDASWVSTDYVSVPVDQVTAVTLQNANGSFEFVKEGDTWTMKDLAAGETLDQSKVMGLVGKARFVSMLRPLGKTADPSWGMDAPSAVVTVQAHVPDASSATPGVTPPANAGTDQTYTLMVGSQDATDNSYVVKASTSDYYVRVTEYTAGELVTDNHESFLQLPPTPTPAPGETPTTP
jgi:hypothetical protein